MWSSLLRNHESNTNIETFQQTSDAEEWLSPTPPNPEGLAALTLYRVPAPADPILSPPWRWGVPSAYLQCYRSRLCTCTPTSQQGNALSVAKISQIQKPTPLVPGLRVSPQLNGWPISFKFKQPLCLSRNGSENPEEVLPKTYPHFLAAITGVCSGSGKRWHLPSNCNLFSGWL